MSTLTTNYHAPTGREEAWRFTPITKLGALLGADAAIAHSETLTASSPLAAGVTLTSVDSVNPLSATEDLVAIRVREIVAGAQVLEIAANAEISEPIALKRSVTATGAVASRLLVKVGVNAHATLIIENSCEATLAEEIEFDLAPGANLTFVTLQEWGQSAIHLAKHHAIVGKDALFTSTVVTIGGSIVRILPTVEYSGQGSSADLAGVYFATDGQHQEHRIFIDHNLPNAKSRVNYKGALAGDKAHSVWIGDVYIRANAEGTDTYELNRNLLLTDGARADSVPNLEIETGEIVGAGHASTTGRFDDEQLFYLESRGIPADEARRLVIRGFFAEIVNRIDIDEIEDRIMDRIDAELAKVGE